MHAESLLESPEALVGLVVLGRYRIVRRLARGGMGIVYLGRVEGAAGFSKPVVIKRMVPAFGAERDSAKLFTREAHIVSRLQHPGIVAVIDFGTVRESYVMVLEYVHGFHLGQWGRYVYESRGRMLVPDAVHAMLRVMDALSHAHALTHPDGSSVGIIHRDVSPANVLIDLHGNVKLSDFGIARTADDDYRTQEGLFRGTLPYSAPEILQGQKPAAAQDQYACAVVLYQLLAGKNPFRADDNRETMARVLTHEPAPLSVLREDVPPGIESAVARAMAKDPAKRFPSIAALAAELRLHLEWSEETAAREFARRIEQDFTGADMPARLKLEALSVRDAAWREAQDAPPERLVGLSSSPPATTETAHDPLFMRRPEVSLTPPAVRESSRAPLITAKPVRRRRDLLAVAAVALAGSSLAAVLLTRGGEGSATPKLLVIEKQQVSASPDALFSNGAAPEATPPSAASAVAEREPGTPAARPSNRPKPAGSAPPAARGTLLARAFQQKQPGIQACFQAHAASIQGSPRLSVRFQVDEAGNVQSAALEPASIGGTPLGGCIVALARGTKFGAQPETVTFSIPITARVVPK